MINFEVGVLHGRTPNYRRRRWTPRLKICPIYHHNVIRVRIVTRIIVICVVVVVVAATNTVLIVGVVIDSGVGVCGGGGGGGGGDGDRRGSVIVITVVRLNKSVGLGFRRGSWERQ
jgi:hypothetical protein